MEPPAQFANQTIRLQFPKNVHWGDDITVWIAKAGDIARTMYLRVAWPTDAPTTVQPSAGTAMIDRIELSYKDQLVERIYGENLYMLGDLTVTEGKQSALNSMVGTTTTTNLASYHIPLVFSILKKGLPLCALDEPPKLRVVFKPSTYFTTAVYTKPIQVDLFVDYVYVTEAEREYMKARELIYVTQSFQRLEFKIPESDKCTISIFTDFVNDVKELFWVIQSDAAENVYDYGTTDQLVNLGLTLNGQDRITPDYATAQYLRVVQGLQSHTRVPTGRYYMYSFALEPENDTPTGELNMTNISRQQHTLTLASSSPRTIRIYALSYNLFSVAKGNGVSLYTLQEGGTMNPAQLPYTPIVTNFRASNPTLTTADLSWTIGRPDIPISYFIITSNPVTTSRNIPPGDTNYTYTFPGLVPETEYTFRIIPVTVDPVEGYTALSNPITTTAIPGPVTGFEAVSSTSTTVELVWDSLDGEGVYYYMIYMVGDESNPAYVYYPDTNYTFPDLVPETEYTFGIIPVTVDLVEGYTAESNPISTAAIPGPVTGFEAVSSTSTAVELVWDSLDGESVEYYMIYVVGDETNPAYVNYGETSFTFPDLVPETEYTFGIIPVNGDLVEGYTAESNTISTGPL